MNDNESHGHNRSGIVTDLATIWWSHIIPRLCMNRYYAAEAVQSLSQNIWRYFLLPNGLGRQLIVKHIDTCVDYYCSMTASKNHMIVEAACQAITELIIHIDHSILSSYIQSLTHHIIVCLHDDRWPVRDVACTSIGIILQHYPSLWYDHDDNLQGQQLSNIVLSSWSRQLIDSIWSVREHTAISISTTLQCHDNIICQLVVDFSLQYIKKHLFLKKKIKQIKNFIPISILNNHTSTTNTTERMPIYNNKMLSSGWGCCIDCVDLRPAENWEICHGALYLLREIMVLNTNLILHDYIRYDNRDVNLYEALMIMLNIDDDGGGANYDGYGSNSDGRTDVFDHKCSVVQLRNFIYSEVSR